jgi:hypothetical protein
MMGSQEFTDCFASKTLSRSDRQPFFAERHVACSHVSVDVYNAKNRCDAGRISVDLNGHLGCLAWTIGDEFHFRYNVVSLLEI